MQSIIQTYTEVPNKSKATGAAYLENRPGAPGPDDPARSEVGIQWSRKLLETGRSLDAISMATRLVFHFHKITSDDQNPAHSGNFWFILNSLLANPD